MTEPQRLTDLVPVDVLTEVNTAIAVLEIQGPAITDALRQLDRATTMAWKAMDDRRGVGARQARNRYRAWLGCGLRAGLHIRPA